MPNRPGRLPGFQYLGFNSYFLTICTDHRLRAFDDLEFGRWAIDQLLMQARARSFAVIAYCLMPDHVHLLVRGQAVTSDLRSFILSWNTRTAFAWRQRYGGRLWQSGYFDRVLREDDHPYSVARYILMNPVKAGLAPTPADYALCGTCGVSLAEVLAAAEDWLP